jgi:hypothetical protein
MAETQSTLVLACVDPRAFSTTIIRPSLISISEWSSPAEQLLLGTAIHESGRFRYRKQIHGPALGLFQMEPVTHDDIWKTFLSYRPSLASKVSALLSSPTADKLHELEFNDQYASAMARIKYLRGGVPLPSLNDIPAMANYWKRFYNTPLGKGTPAQFVRDWKTLMGST